ncbi:ABC transporter permease [Frankia sp. AgB1.9]|uniref:ABC transporter permease n=1 Tax=unclassified Frankia TaxID=2632575 RepID=UPI001933086D|nr:MULTISPECIES: ABC transporter permease [unclassified Frankia]MBL7492618.1 ABC transporter permease [Frankia sp. AgW1.1]MBL7549321.1 ABC transporter permease [Frankia sp. AgB1.9]MBL7619212.1 ABC transporter permease [Frankia sp. AgB1.8]
MRNFVVARLGQAILCVWGVVTIVFALTKVIPGDPARIAAGQTATPAQIEQARAALGLNHPWIVQYLDFIGRAFRGDLGTSTVTHQPVLHDLAQTIPTTIQLVALGLLIIIVLGIPIGVLAAYFENRPVDGGLRVLLAFLGGAPVFWVAILIQFVFAAKLRIVPISGSNDYGLAPAHHTGFTLIDSVVDGNAPAFFNSLTHLLLPAFALAAPFLAHLARNVRTTMIGALRTDYVTFAHSKGLDTRRVVFHHALRATLASSITMLGMQFGWMIGSALLVETVFGLPGVGTYLNQAVLSQDIFAVLGGVLVIGVVFIVSSLIVDLVQIRFDPRVRAAMLAEAAR